MPDATVMAICTAAVLLLIGVDYGIRRYQSREVELNFKVKGGRSFTIKSRRAYESVDQLDTVHLWKNLPSTAKQWTNSLPKEKLKSWELKVVASWQSSGTPKKVFGDFTPSDTIHLEVRDVNTHLTDVIQAIRNEVGNSKHAKLSARVNEDTDEILNLIHEIYQETFTSDGPDGFKHALKKYGFTHKTFMTAVRKDFTTCADFLRDSNCGQALRKGTTVKFSWLNYEDKPQSLEKCNKKSDVNHWRLVTLIEDQLKWLRYGGYDMREERSVKPGTFNVALISPSGTTTTDCFVTKTQTDLGKRPDGKATRQNPDIRTNSTTGPKKVSSKPGGDADGANGKDLDPKKKSDLTILWVILAILGAALIGFLIWFFACRKTDAEQALDAYDAQDPVPHRNRGERRRHRDYV